VVADGSEKADVSIHAPLHRNNASTFATLYKVVKDSKVKDQKTILKADRNILQSLLTAYEAGREVDLSAVLTHELLPVLIPAAAIVRSRACARTICIVCAWPCLLVCSFRLGRKSDCDEVLSDP